MATKNFNWKGDWYKDRIKQAIFKAVYAGAMIIRGGIKAKLNLKASNRSNPNGAPSAPGAPPARATGHLATSIQIAPDINQPVVKIGTMVKYARVHELGVPGGYITPKKGKYLSVPFSKQAKRAAAEGQGPKDNKALKFVRARSGDGLLVESRGKGKRAKTIVHWLLKKRVRVHKRPFFLPGFLASKQEAMAKIKETIRREMRTK